MRLRGQRPRTLNRSQFRFPVPEAHATAHKTQGRASFLPRHKPYFLLALVHSKVGTRGGCTGVTVTAGTDSPRFLTGQPDPTHSRCSARHRRCCSHFPESQRKAEPARATRHTAPGLRRPCRGLERPSSLHRIYSGAAPRGGPGAEAGLAPRRSAPSLLPSPPGSQGPRHRALPPLVGRARSRQDDKEVLHPTRFP